MSSSKTGSTIALIAVLILVAAGGLLYMHYTSVPTNVAYVTEEEGGVSVIDLNTLQVTKRVHPPGVAPRGIGITVDGKYLLVANKDTADVSAFATRWLAEIRKIHLGDNPEFIKIDPSGQWFFTSYEPGSTGGPPGQAPAPAADDDAAEKPSEIVTVSTQNWSTGATFTAGLETEGLAFSADGKQLIVANEAQNNLGVYDVAAKKLIQDLDLKPYGERPRGVKLSPLGNEYAITMEGSGTLLTLDTNFHVIKTVQTEAKPYGVAFDRSGKRIFVAAAMAKKLQVFSSDTLQPLGEAPLGARCWHFTFTPDDSKLLLACGRSNAIYVIDANTYKPITTISGFKLPWGIVTYPRSYGTLGLP